MSTLNGDPASRMWKHHHIDKARRALDAADRNLMNFDEEYDVMRATIMLDLLDALEHAALAYGLYVPGIGMEKRDDLKVAE